ncbi:MAG: hypothetical protein AAFR26_20125 [Cyanobacteria bacterium J06626_4]
MTLLPSSQHHPVGSSRLVGRLFFIGYGTTPESHHSRIGLINNSNGSRSPCMAYQFVKGADRGGSVGQY